TLFRSWLICPGGSIRHSGLGVIVDGFRFSQFGLSCLSTSAMDSGSKYPLYHFLACVSFLQSSTFGIVSAAPSFSPARFLRHSYCLRATNSLPYTSLSLFCTLTKDKDVYGKLLDRKSTRL